MTDPETAMRLRLFGTQQGSVEVDVWLLHLIVNDISIASFDCSFNLIVYVWLLHLIAICRVEQSPPPMFEETLPHHCCEAFHKHWQSVRNQHFQKEARQWHWEDEGSMELDR